MNKIHSFVLCAYKESEYLEACVKSLMEQTVNSEIIVCTSTPNEHIKGISEKYGLELKVRNGKSDIQDDWNFAVSQATTPWVTVAHQDDLYDAKYVEMLLEKVKKHDDGIMFFSDYRPLHGTRTEPDLNSRIKKILRTPMKFDCFSKRRFFKKVILAFGNSINCPSVAYNLEKIEGNVFTSDLKFGLDWETFFKFADSEGRFLYYNKPLTYYRIHDEATSKAFIVNNKRVEEDIYMFNKFWPSFVTKIIMVFYKKAYDAYN